MEAGASGDHNRSGRRLDPIEDIDPGSLEFRDRVFICWIGDVDEVVDESLPGTGIRLRRSDVHPAEHLHRVDRENLCSDSVGDRLGNLGLPGCGGAEYGDDVQTRIPSR